MSHLDQVCDRLAGKDRYLRRVQTLRGIRNRIASDGYDAPLTVEENAEPGFPGCRVHIVFPGESKEQEVRLSIVAWDDRYFEDLEEDSDWLEIALVVGGHVREPVRVSLYDAAEYVESFVGAMIRLC